MPLPELEANVVARRAAEVDAVIAACGSATRERRARVVAAQLEAIHGDWWDVHDADRHAYARDVARLNDLARWKNEYAQVTTVERDRRRFVTPPKFFGGDPTRLADVFLLAVSLNHATPKRKPAYVHELSEWQQRAACFEAHREYFLRPYVHEAFFAPRVTLLRSYVRARGEASAPENGWLLNHRYSLYLECYPTHSQRSGASRVTHDVLEKEVFVMALNGLARKLVLTLLRPTAVLLAGHDAAALLPTRAAIPVSRHVRPNQTRPCRASLDELPGSDGAAPCRVLRCSPLNSMNGPAGDSEYAAVGELLGAPDAYARLAAEHGHR